MNGSTRVADVSLAPAVGAVGAPAVPPATRLADERSARGRGRRRPGTSTEAGADGVAGR